MHEFWTFDGIPPESCALVRPEGVCVTYGALSRMADEWARYLEAQTVGRRCLVAIELDVDPNSVAAYLGALRAGYPALILAPGDIALGSGIVAAWNPEVCITSGATNPVARHLPETGTAEPHQDLSVLLSTSGSTGEPKLVRLSGRNIASNACSIAEYLCLSPADRAATTLPLHYSYGLSVLNSYLSAGASIVLIRQSVTEPAFWNEARIGKVTSLAFVPHQMELLSRSGFSGAELPSLRYMTQAGGKLAPAILRRFNSMAKENGWQLFVMYGQTEASPRISYVPPDALPGAADTVGRAIPGGRLWLAALDGTEITTTGQPGELVYEGPNVMMGYATTRADLLRGQDLTELHTGDIAERTEAGYFRIVGRMKRFAKLFGLRISLDQIEAFLADRDVEAYAVALDDKLVILHHDTVRGAGATTALVNAYGLPPASVHAGFAPDIPRLPSGKPDQVGIRRIATDMLLASERLQLSKTLAEVLREATRSDRVGPDDSFNALGGDSLSYLQVQLALEERLGRAPRGWETMPLAKLEEMARETNVAVGAPVRIGVDVPLRLAAITLVVVQHATEYPLYGGTWMLIALMGYSMARFQLQKIATGQSLRLAVPLLYPLLPLYFLLLATYALLRDSVPLSYWLLFGNYKIWHQGSLLEVYWFVSLYAQIVFLMVLIAAAPSLRNALLLRPWETMALASSASVIYLAGLAVWHDRVGLPYLPQRGLLECMSVFLLGWMLQCRQGRGHLLLTVFLTVPVLGLLSQVGMSWFVSGALLGTLFLLGLSPMIPVPAFWGRTSTLLASVTLYVYLVHEIVIFIALKATLPQPLTAALALTVSFAVGICAQKSVRNFERWISTNRMLRFICPKKPKSTNAARS